MVEGSGGYRARGPRVARLAQELVVYASDVEAELRGRRAALNRHLQEAAASVLANVGEGLEEQSRGDKRRFFRYAMRSSGECEHLLRALGAVGALQPATLDRGAPLLRNLRHDLLRLIRWAQ
jgi:four helix bundle protein